MTIQDWQRRADRNVERFGLQDPDELLLAMQEELGELTQVYLDGEVVPPEEADEVDTIYELRAELADLMALGIQLDMAITELENE